MPTVRWGTRADSPFCKECAEQAYAIYTPRIGKRPAPMDQNFEAAADAQELLIAEEDHQQMGYAVLRKMDQTLFLENIAVSPSKQGLGVGKALFLHLEALGRKLGCQTIELYTNAKMHENIKLYKAVGYQETKRESQNGFDRVFFEKHL